MDNGGILRGFAELSSEALVTSKVLMSAGGYALVRIEEHFEVISEADYMGIYQSLTGQQPQWQDSLR